MNILTGNCPVSIQVAGQFLKIDTSFSTCLLFKELVQDQAVKSVDKMYIAFKMFFDESDFKFIEHNKIEALNAIVDFVEFDKKDKKDKPTLKELGIIAPALEKEQEEEAKLSNVKSFDFDYDNFYVYAAFMQVYHIDLTVTKLHWFKFNALFTGLPTNTKLADIINIRTKELPKPSSNNISYINALIELKERYALPQVEDKNEDLDNKAQIEYIDKLLL